MAYRRARSRSVVLGSRPMDEDERDLLNGARSPAMGPSAASLDYAHSESFVAQGSSSFAGDVARNSPLHHPSEHGEVSPTNASGAGDGGVVRMRPLSPSWNPAGGVDGARRGSLAGVSLEGDDELAAMGGGQSGSNIAMSISLPSGAIGGSPSVVSTSPIPGSRGGGGGKRSGKSRAGHINAATSRYSITRPIFVQVELTIEVDYYTRYPLHFFVFHGDRLSENLVECIHDCIAQGTFNVSALAKEVLGPLPNVDYVQLSSVSNAAEKGRFGESSVGQPVKPRQATRIQAVAGRALDVDPDTQQLLGVQGRPCEGAFVLIYSSLPDLPDARTRSLTGPPLSSTYATLLESAEEDERLAAAALNSSKAPTIMESLRDPRDGDRKETSLLLAVREVLVEDRKWRMIETSKCTLSSRDVHLLERTICNGQLHKQLQLHAGLGARRKEDEGGHLQQGNNATSGEESSAQRSLASSHVEGEDEGHATAALSPRSKLKLDHLLGIQHVPATGATSGLSGLGSVFEDDAAVEQTRMVFKKVVTVERHEDITDTVVKEEEERIYYVQQGQALYVHAVQHAQYSALCCEYDAQMKERDSRRGSSTAAASKTTAVLPSATAPHNNRSFYQRSPSAGVVPLGAPPLNAGGTSRRRGSSLIVGGTTAVRMSVPGVADKSKGSAHDKGEDMLSEDLSPEVLTEERCEDAKSKVARLTRWFEAVQSSLIPISFVDYAGRTLLHWLVDWAECFSHPPTPSSASDAAASSATTKRPLSTRSRTGGADGGAAAPSTLASFRKLRSMMVFCLDSGISPLLCGIDRRSIIDLACQPGREVALAVLCEVVRAQQLTIFPPSSLSAGGKIIAPSSNAVAALPDPVFETSPLFDVSSSAFSATQPNILLCVEAPNAPSSTSRKGGSSTSQRSSPTTNWLLTMYDLSLERTLLVCDFSEPAHHTSLSLVGGSSTHAPKFQVLPFHSTTHRTTTSDILILSTGAFVAIDYSAPKFPKITVQTPQDTILPGLKAKLPKKGVPWAERRFLETFSFALLGLDTRFEGGVSSSFRHDEGEERSPYTSEPTFNFIFHWVNKSDSALEVRSKALLRTTGAAASSHSLAPLAGGGRRALLAGGGGGGLHSSKGDRSVERLKHQAYVARMTHELEILQGTAEQERERKRFRLRTLESTGEDGDVTADNDDENKSGNPVAAEDDASPHNNFVNKLLLFPYGPASNHPHPQTSGPNINNPTGGPLPPLSTSSSSSPAGTVSAMKDFHRTAAVLCFQQRTRLFFVHFFEGELRFPTSATVSERATFLMESVISKLQKHASHFVSDREDSDAGVLDAHHSSGSFADAPSFLAGSSPASNAASLPHTVRTSGAPLDLFHFDLGPLCRRELNVDAHVVGDAILPIDGCKRRIIVGLPNERVLQYDCETHSFTILGIGTDTRGSRRGQMPSSVLAVNRTSCRGREDRQYRFGAGDSAAPALVGPQRSSSSGSSSDGSGGGMEQNGIVGDAAQQTHSRVSNPASRPTKSNPTKRNIFAADLRIGGVVAPSFWKVRGQLLANNTSMDVLVTRAEPSHIAGSQNGKRRRLAPATFVWAGKDLYCHTIDDSTLALPELQLLSNTEANRRFHAARRPTSSDADASWEGEDNICLATSPVDETGVYFTRGGLLCRLDRRNRTIHALYRLPLCASEMTLRSEDGDDMSGALSAGAEHISFNCDGSKMLRYNSVYTTCSIYDVSTHLYQRVQAVSEEVLSKAVFVSGVPWDGCREFFSSLSISSATGGGGSSCTVTPQEASMILRWIGNGEHDVDVTCVPKGLLRGFLRRLSSLSSATGEPDAAATTMHAQRLLRAVTSPVCGYHPNLRDADGRVAAAVVAAAVALSPTTSHPLIESYWSLLLRHGASLYIPSAAGVTPLNVINAQQMSQHPNHLAIHKYQEAQRCILEELIPITSSLSSSSSSAVRALRPLTTPHPLPSHSPSGGALSNFSLTNAGYFLTDGALYGFTRNDVNPINHLLFECFEDGATISSANAAPFRFLLVPHAGDSADSLNILRKELLGGDAAKGGTSPATVSTVPLPSCLPLVPLNTDVILLSTGRVVVVEWTSDGVPRVGVSSFDPSLVFPQNIAMADHCGAHSGSPVVRFETAGQGQHERMPVMVSSFALHPLSHQTTSKAYRRSMRNVLRATVRLEVLHGQQMSHAHQGAPLPSCNSGPSATIAARYRRFRKDHSPLWGQESYQRAKILQRMRQERRDREHATDEDDSRSALTSAAAAVPLVMPPAGSEVLSELEFLVGRHIPSSSSDDEPLEDLETQHEYANCEEMLPGGTVVSLSMGQPSDPASPSLHANTTVLMFPHADCVQLLSAVLFGRNWDANVLASIVGSVLTASHPCLSELSALSDGSSRARCDAPVLGIPVACCMPTCDVFLVATAVPSANDQIRLYVGTRHCFGRRISGDDSTRILPSPSLPPPANTNSILWRRANVGGYRGGSHLGSCRRASLSASVDATAGVLRMCLGVLCTHVLSVGLEEVFPPPPSSRLAAAPSSISPLVLRATTQLPPVILARPAAFHAPPHADNTVELSRSAWVSTSAVVNGFVDLIKGDQKSCRKQGGLGAQEDDEAALLRAARLEVAKMWLAKMSGAADHILLIQRGGCLVVHMAGGGDASYVVTPLLAGHHNTSTSTPGSLIDVDVSDRELRGEGYPLTLCTTPHAKLPRRCTASLWGVGSTIATPLCEVLVASIASVGVREVLSNSPDATGSLLGGNPLPPSLLAQVAGRCKAVGEMLTLCDGVGYTERSASTAATSKTTSPSSAAKRKNDNSAAAAVAAPLFVLPQGCSLTSTMQRPSLLSSLCSSHWWIPRDNTTAGQQPAHSRVVAPSVAALYLQVCAFLDAIEAGSVPPSHTDACSRNVIHTFICLLETLLSGHQTPAMGAVSVEGLDHSPLLPREVQFWLVRRITHTRGSIFTIDPVTGVAPVDCAALQDLLTRVRVEDAHRIEARGRSAGLLPEGVHSVVPVRAFDGAEMAVVKQVAWSAAVPDMLYTLSNRNTLHLTAVHTGKDEAAAAPVFVLTLPDATVPSNTAVAVRITSMTSSSMYDHDDDASRATKTLLQDQKPCDLVLFSCGAYALVYFDVRRDGGGWQLSNVTLEATGGFAWCTDVASPSAANLVDSSRPHARHPSPHHVGLEATWFVTGGQRLVDHEHYVSSVLAFKNSTSTTQRHQHAEADDGSPSLTMSNDDFFGNLPPFDSSKPLGMVASCIGDGEFETVEFFAPPGITRFFPRHVSHIFKAFHEAQTAAAIAATANSSLVVGGGSRLSSPLDSSLELPTPTSDANALPSEISATVAPSVSEKPSREQRGQLLRLYPTLAGPINRIRELRSTLRAAEARERDQATERDLADVAIRARALLEIEVAREERAAVRASSCARVRFISFSKVDAACLARSVRPTLDNHLQTSHRIPLFQHTYIEFVQPAQAPKRRASFDQLSGGFVGGRLVVSRKAGEAADGAPHEAFVFAVPGMGFMGRLGGEAAVAAAGLASHPTPFFLPPPTASFFVCGTLAAIGTCVWGGQGGLNVMQETPKPNTLDATQHLNPSRLILTSATVDTNTDLNSESVLRTPINRSACCVGIHPSNGLCVVAECKDVAYQPLLSSSSSALVVYDLRIGTASRVYLKLPPHAAPTNEGAWLPQHDTGHIAVCFAPHGSMFTVQNLRTGALVIVSTTALSPGSSQGAAGSTTGRPTRDNTLRFPPSQGRRQLLYNTAFVHGLSAATDCASLGLDGDNSSARQSSMDTVFEHLISRSCVPKHFLDEARFQQEELRCGYSKCCPPTVNFQDRLSLLKECRLRHNAMHSAVAMACQQAPFASTAATDVPITVASIVDMYGHNALVSLILLHQQWWAMAGVTECLAAGHGEFQAGCEMIAMEIEHELKEDAARARAKSSGAPPLPLSSSNTPETSLVHKSQGCHGAESSHQRSRRSSFDVPDAVFDVPATAEDLRAIQEGASLHSDHRNRFTTATLNDLKRSMLRAFAVKLQFYLALGILLAEPIPNGPLAGTTPLELLLLDSSLPLRSSFDVTVFSPQRRLVGVLNAALRPLRDVAIGLIRKSTAAGLTQLVAASCDRFDVERSQVRPAMIGWVGNSPLRRNWAGTPRTLAAATDDKGTRRPLSSAAGGGDLGIFVAKVGGWMAPPASGKTIIPQLDNPTLLPPPPKSSGGIHKGREYQAVILIDCEEDDEAPASVHAASMTTAAGQQQGEDGRFFASMGSTNSTAAGASPPGSHRPSLDNAATAGGGPHCLHRTTIPSTAPNPIRAARRYHLRCIATCISSGITVEKTVHLPQQHPLISDHALPRWPTVSVVSMPPSSNGGSSTIMLCTFGGVLRMVVREIPMGDMYMRRSSGGGDVFADSNIAENWGPTFEVLVEKVKRTDDDDDDRTHPMIASESQSVGGWLLAPMANESLGNSVATAHPRATDSSSVRAPSNRATNLSEIIPPTASDTLNANVVGSSKVDAEDITSQGHDPQKQDIPNDDVGAFGSPFGLDSSLPVVAASTFLPSPKLYAPSPQHRNSSSLPSSGGLPPLTDVKSHIHNNPTLSSSVQTTHSTRDALVCLDTPVSFSACCYTITDADAANTSLSSNPTGVALLNHVSVCAVGVVQSPSGTRGRAGSVPIAGASGSKGATIATSMTLIVSHVSNVPVASEMSTASIATALEAATQQVVSLPHASSMLTSTTATPEMLARHSLPSTTITAVPPSLGGGGPNAATNFNAPPIEASLKLQTWRACLTNVLANAESVGDRFSTSSRHTHRCMDASVHLCSNGCLLLVLFSEEEVDFLHGPSPTAPRQCRIALLWSSMASLRGLDPKTDDNSDCGAEAKFKCIFMYELSALTHSSPTSLLEVASVDMPSNLLAESEPSTATVTFPTTVVTVDLLCGVLRLRVPLSMSPLLTNPAFPAVAVASSATPSSATPPLADLPLEFSNAYPSADFSTTLVGGLSTVSPSATADDPTARAADTAEILPPSLFPAPLRVVRWVGASKAAMLEVPMEAVVAYVRTHLAREMPALSSDDAVTSPRDAAGSGAPSAYLYLFDISNSSKASSTVKCVSLDVGPLYDHAVEFATHRLQTVGLMGGEHGVGDGVAAVVAEWRNGIGRDATLEHDGTISKNNTSSGDNRPSSSMTAPSSYAISESSPQLVASSAIPQAGPHPPPSPLNPHIVLTMPPLPNYTSPAADEAAGTAIEAAMASRTTSLVAGQGGDDNEEEGGGLPFQKTREEGATSSTNASEEAYDADDNDAAVVVLDISLEAALGLADVAVYLSTLTMDDDMEVVDIEADGGFPGASAPPASVPSYPFLRHLQQIASCADSKFTTVSSDPLQRLPQLRERRYASGVAAAILHATSTVPSRSVGSTNLLPAMM